MTCPICNKISNPTRSYLPRFVCCNICKGHFLKRKVKANYPEEYFDQKGASSILSMLFSPFLEFLLYLKVQNIISQVCVRKPQILDYGCGSGKLIEALLKKQITATGYEPSLGALSITKRKKLPVFNQLKKAKGGYDLVMFWHSLEHVSSPYQVMTVIKKLLSKQGKVLVAIPNGDSWEAEIAREKWFHYSYPLHVIHFTPKSVKMMLENAGFKNIKIDFFNPEYTISGLLQTFLNLFFPNDVLYSVVTHRRLSMPLFSALIYSFLSVILAVFFSPFLILIFALQLIFRKSGAMVIIAKS